MNNQTLIDAYLNENGFEDLKDYEGKYKINREGKIWSIKQKKELSTSTDKGHKRIGLMTNGKQKQYRISELIKIQYEGKNNEYIHHIDLTDFEDLKDFEGLYKINRNGDIWSCVYNKLMKSSVSEDGYLKINLTMNGAGYKRSIHRLLAIQYIPNPDNLPEIDHIDRNKLNNDLSNLRWCSRFVNANNRSSCISLMTEEEQQKRIDDRREYKRVWAEKKARANGIKPKGPNITNTTEYKNEWRKNKINNMNDEEKGIYENRANELQRKRRLYEKQCEVFRNILF